MAWIKKIRKFANYDDDSILIGWIVSRKCYRWFFYNRHWQRSEIYLIQVTLYQLLVWACTKGLGSNWQVKLIIKKSISICHPKVAFCVLRICRLKCFSLKCAITKKLRSANWPKTNSSFKVRQNNVEYFTILHSSKC